MNNIFIDVDYAQIYKHGQRIGGDVFLLSRNPESNQIVCTLSDGLGSGVKAESKTRDSYGLVVRVLRADLEKRLIEDQILKK